MICWRRYTAPHGASEGSLLIDVPAMAQNRRAGRLHKYPQGALVSFDLDGFIVGHRVAKRSMQRPHNRTARAELYRRRARAVAYRATNATQIDQKKSR